MTRVKIIFPDDDPRWNYVRGAFPKNKAEARELIVIFWQEVLFIRYSLMPI